MTTTELARLAAMQRLETGRLTQAEVARQLGLSVRQVKRLWSRYRLDPKGGLLSRRRGRPSNRRTDPALLDRAVEIMQKHYADFGPTFAAEKLRECDGVVIDHETLRRALIARGLWHPKAQRKRATHPPRERRPCFGELAQIDGSHHAWFEGRAPRCTLYVDVDDATTKLLALYFDEQETTDGYFELARLHALAHGLPLAYYADKYSVFRVNSPADKDARTQFGRAMDQLGIALICANSPQAKGRVERANGTLQDRLIKELRLRNISTISQANAYAPEFIAHYNAKFAKRPACELDAHRPAPPVEELDRILSIHEPRIVSKSLTLQYESTVYEILEPADARRLRHTTVVVRSDRSGRLRIERNGKSLRFRALPRQLLTPILSPKQLEAAKPGLVRPHYPEKARTPAIKHPWRRYPHPLGDISTESTGDITAES